MISASESEGRRRIVRKPSTVGDHEDIPVEGKRSDAGMKPPKAHQTTGKWLAWREKGAFCAIEKMTKCERFFARL
jgi:hypothetical protein